MTQDNKCKVVFRKDGKKIQLDDIDTGKTLLEIANENDVQIDQACGGNGVCTTCMVKVKSGSENLNEMTEKEGMMGLDPEQPEIRLGCLCKVNGGSCDAEIAF